jgi:predicted Zn-dependent protease
LGNLTVALAHFEAAALLQPDRTEADVASARVYLTRGENARAIPLLRRAARKAPDDASIATLLAEAEKRPASKK